MESILKNIIDKFAKSGIFFSNEQDFQFKLAIALKEKPGVKSVKLEAIALKKNSWANVKSKAQDKSLIGKQEKEYIDILLELDNGEYIAIELKYKTPDKMCYYETLAGEMVTFRQGAYNLGTYGFYRDISRLEDICSKTMVQDSQNLIKQRYAIMLTNDWHYRFGRPNGIWQNYRLTDGEQVDPGQLFSNAPSKPFYKTKKETYQAIELNNSYTFNWQNYPLKTYTNYKLQR